MIKHTSICFCLMVAFCLAGNGNGQPFASHPSKLSYAALKWSVPLGDPFRTVLKNGLRAYIAVDSLLPYVQIHAYIRSGTLLDPKGKEGLGSLAATLMRTGGTEKFSPDSLDALIDLYAMNFTISASEDNTLFRASFLSDYIDTAFIILQQMLLKPRFDGSKLEKERNIIIQGIRHRFDNPGPTLDIAYQKALYPASAASGLITEQSIKRITRNDCIDLHSRSVTTGNIILAISGKFDRTAMIKRLEDLFPAAKKLSDTSFPPVSAGSKTKCLVVHKPISQVYARFGVPLFKRPNDDYYSVSVANLILGGGGFTSRLGTKVRSDAGLTYSIYSNAESNYTFPATWYVEFFTKSESLPLALALSVQEIDSLRKNGVTAAELSNAKSSLIDEMPSMFRSPFDIVSTYAWNEFYGRSPNIFKNYPDSIRAMTKDKVQHVIQKYLDPANYTYVLVGDTTAIAKYKNSVDGFSLEKLLPRKTIVADSIPSLP